MNRQEHLLSIAAEECNEVAQRLIKAQRFGIRETQPGQSLDNHERIRLELCDLMAVIRMIDASLVDCTEDELVAKMRRVEFYLEYSRSQGTLI